MQAGGDAGDDGLRELVGERLDERVALPAVAAAHAAQVPVELAARDEVGERVLLDAGGAPVGDELVVRRPPAAASREARASRAGAPARASCSSCRRTRCDRARGPGARPRRRGRSGTRRRSRPRSRSAPRSRSQAISASAPLAAEHDAGGLLVRGRHDHGVGRGPRRARRRACPLVDPDRHDLEAGARRRCPVVEGAGSSIADPLAPAATSALADERQPLRVADVTTMRSGSATTPRTRPR